MKKKEPVSLASVGEEIQKEPTRRTVEEELQNVEFIEITYKGFVVRLTNFDIEVLEKGD